MQADGEGAEETASGTGTLRGQERTSGKLSAGFVCLFILEHVRACSVAKSDS